MIRRVDEVYYDGGETVTIAATLPAAIAERLFTEARRRGVAPSAVIAQALDEALAARAASSLTVIELHRPAPVRHLAR